jgi:crotonobetainyl-CoA:carnitine CoA-transferase CaiB-like acyl-CoA transferase
VRIAPPQLGQHTAPVLRSLGVSDDEIAQLRDEKVI